MREITFNTRKALWHGSVLVVLCASAVFAGNSSKDALPEKAGSMSEWLQKRRFPEIKYLRGRADSENASPQERELAQRVIERWDNGVVDPEPILVDAWLRRGKLDEYTGRMMYGLLDMAASGTAPAALHVRVVDEDRDLLGVRVREKYVLPNGVESSFEETYPAYIDGLQKTTFLGTTFVPVHFRTGNRVKNEERWQAYVDRVGRRAGSAKMAKPPIWITAPDPNAVEVSISVYDRQGHESGTVLVQFTSDDAKKSSAFSERHTLKPYKEHGADIARWPDEATKPRPDNAALLYYRAAACYRPPDPCTDRITTLMTHGREPDDRVRKYLGSCLTAIQLAQLASQIPQCDWGLVHDPVWEHTTETFSSLRRLSRTLATHARTLAADGHYRAAFENCLVIRRLAHHISDPTWFFYLISRSVDARATFSILNVLGNMPSDVESLTWLRDQLATVAGTPSPPAVAFGKWCDLEVQEWGLYQGDRPFERSWALEQIEDEAERKEAIELTDEQLLVRLLNLQRNYRDRQYGLAVPPELFARARQGYDAFVGSAVRVMESDVPYKQKQTRLSELADGFYDRVKRCEPIALLDCAPTAVQKYHELLVRDATFFNLLKVAVEVLLVAAQTERVPEMLPEGPPKDLYTGEDFKYERTETGFVLSLDPANLSGMRRRKYAFIVRSR